MTGSVPPSVNSRLEASVKEVRIWSGGTSSAGDGPFVDGMRPRPSGSIVISNGGVPGRGNGTASENDSALPAATPSFDGHEPPNPGPPWNSESRLIVIVAPRDFRSHVVP